MTSAARRPCGPASVSVLRDIPRGMANLIDRDAIYSIVEPVFGWVLHRKRVLSLALATLGVLYTRRLSVAEIGRKLAGATGKSPKHGIKQVDRLLSNDGINLDAVIGTMSAY